MFDIGWPEMLVVAIVLIVIVGPKDLPAMLRTFGRTTSKLRSMAGDFRKQFDEAHQILSTDLELRHRGQEETAFRFRLTDAGDLVEGSVSTLRRPLITGQGFMGN